VAESCQPGNKPSGRGTFWLAERLLIYQAGLCPWRWSGKMEDWTTDWCPLSTRGRHTMVCRLYSFLNSMSRRAKQNDKLQALPCSVTATHLLPIPMKQIQTSNFTNSNSHKTKHNAVRAPLINVVLQYYVTEWISNYVTTNINTVTGPCLITSVEYKQNVIKAPITLNTIIN
jgi:hypothetical protein